MRAFWFGKAVGGNWGDSFNLPLLTRLAGETPERYDGPGKLLAVGSVLHKLAEGDTVWGSGALSPDFVPIPIPARIRWCAVRGPLTLDFLLDQGQEVPEIYGDPGLLVAHLYRPSTVVTHRLGIIPHYKDYSALAHLESDTVRVIDIRSGIIEVVRAVASCEHIASSSLHGIVLGDAFRKPTAWLRVDGGARLLGNDWKFQDYLLGTGRPGCVPADMRWGASLALLAWLPPPIVDLAQLLAACPLHPLGRPWLLSDLVPEEI